eukprot:1745808-Karenia_brevis.AAC.1
MQRTYVFGKSWDLKLDGAGGSNTNVKGSRKDAAPFTGKNPGQAKGKFGKKGDNTVYRNQKGGAKSSSSI